MGLHKNSQKRIYSPGAIYFITTNTENRYPFFAEDIFCEIFLSDLQICLELKKFEILGYKINPDHVHLLIKPGIEYNYSQIIQNLKRTSSLHINEIIQHANDPECTNIYSRIQEKSRPFPRFKWQKSFHDHIIRNNRDLQNHLRYIQIQWLKHELEENKWCFTGTDSRLLGKR